MRDFVIKGILQRHSVPEEELTQDLIHAISAQVEQDQRLFESSVMAIYYKLRGVLPNETPEDAPATPPDAPVAPPPTDPNQPMTMTIIQLPNGKEKEEYRTVLDAKALGLGDATLHAIGGAEEYGLQFDPLSNTLSGFPSQPGTLELVLHYHSAAKTSGLQQAKLLLFINFDPKSLWKAFEPPSDSLFPKPHERCERLQHGGKTLIAASKRGRSHAKDAKFREDDFGIAYLEEGQWWLISVADGKGSSKYSRRGSEVLCDTVIGTLKGDDYLGKLAYLQQQVAQLDDLSSPAVQQSIRVELYSLLVEASFKGLQAVRTEATQANLPLEEFYSTHLLAIACPVKAGWFIAGFWRGDGGMGIYTKDQPPILLGKADSGEFSGQTAFLDFGFFQDANETISRLHFQIMPDFDALILMTDGITDAWFQTEGNLGKEALWQEMLQSINKSAPLTPNNENAHLQLLDWLDFWFKGEYDDRTIAILY